MKQGRTLATRAFLFGSVPMVMTLVLSFIVVSQAVEGRIRRQLRESLQKTEAMLSRREAAYSQHNLRLLSILTENPSLKAGISLLREGWDGRLQEQVHATLVSQLMQMSESLDYELFVLNDPAGKPVAGIVGRQRTRMPLALDSQSVEVLAPSLVRVEEDLYEAVSVPINLEDENLGTLIVGRAFSVEGWSELGNTALFQNGRILLTTFPPGQMKEVEQQVGMRCSSIPQECEIRVGREAYFALPVRQ